MTFLPTKLKYSIAVAMLTILPAVPVVAQNAGAQIRALESDARAARSRLAPSMTLSQMARGAPRIIGGHAAIIPGQWEFTVNIVRDDGAMCGGSLISPNIDVFLGENYVKNWLPNSTKNLWVLTAAHCMLNEEGKPVAASRLRIKSGIQDLIGSISPVLLEGEEVFVHPDYIEDNVTLGNDIALIRLSEPNIPGGANELNSVANPRSIQLPTDLNAPLIYRPGTRQIVNGWGRYGTENGPISTMLQTADIPYLNQQECFAQYETINGEIARGSYCAGWLQGGVDSCSGDSGGPLFYPGGHTGLISNQPVLAGIVSWGKGCARVGYPGIYTSVFFFKDWIEGVVAQG